MHHASMPLLTQLIQHFYSHGMLPLSMRLPLQVVVSKHSSLVGKTVVSSRFRRKYKAAVIGWHREEKRTPLAPKDLVIQVRAHTV